jgi:hypothetical protein
LDIEEFFIAARIISEPIVPAVNFYCLSTNIAYGDGFSRRQLKHAVFFASALSGRNQATRYEVVVDFCRRYACLRTTAIRQAEALIKKCFPHYRDTLLQPKFQTKCKRRRFAACWFLTTGGHAATLLH